MRQSSKFRWNTWTLTTSSKHWRNEWHPQLSIVQHKKKESFNSQVCVFVCVCVYVCGVSVLWHLSLLAPYGTLGLQPLTGTPDLGIKMKKIPRVIKGRFYVTTPLSDSWEAFTPIHAGVTLGRFLHQLVVAFFSPTSIESIIYGKILH